GRLDITVGQVELEPIFKGVMSTAVGLVGGKPVKLTRETPDPVPDVLGDPVRVRQVLLNLYSNAAKFTDEGFIKLAMQVDEANQRAIISVQDTGEGIQPEDLAQIFEEFKQGTSGRKQARAGSGLGLTISRQLLGLMGGDIWAESVYGEGSTFFVALPLYTPEAEAATNLTAEHGA
ncbi:MAG: sensor histidine kinase, partial [Anaerolineales bacterium]